MAVHRQAGEHEQAEAGDRGAHDGDRAHADLRDEALSEPGAEDDPAGDRQEREAGLQGGVPEDLLDVEGGEEEHAEQR